MVSRQQAPYRDVMGAGHLPAFEDEVCLAEICILRWNTENSWNSDTLFYAMKNMVEELFADCDCKAVLTELAQQDYCCMVWGGKAPDASSAAKQFEYLRSAFRLYFHGEAAVYLLSPVLVRDLPEARERLTAAHADNIARQSLVQVCGSESTAAGTRAAAGAFDSGEIARLLGQGLSAQAQAKLFGWLDQLLAEGKLDAAALRGFYQDFMQALYSIAEESGVDPKTLFDTAGAFELYRNATHSVEEMKTFLAYVCSQYEGLAGEEGSRRIVLKAEEYIKHNLEKNIRRDDVAAYAHVSAGYLSHLFSRERGCSLKEYIVRQKCCWPARCCERRLCQSALWPCGWGTRTFPCSPKVTRRRSNALPAPSARPWNRSRNCDAGQEDGAPHLSARCGGHGFAAGRLRQNGKLCGPSCARGAAGGTAVGDRRDQ